MRQPKILIACGRGRRMSRNLLRNFENDHACFRRYWWAHYPTKLKPPYAALPRAKRSPL